MAPSITLDTTPDMDMTTNTTRTLLLAPPSISSHPSALDAIFQAHDRSATDIQMLDRLALGLVSLPASTYDLILILTDASGSTTESDGLLDRGVLGRLVAALKTGGRLQSQNGGNIAAGVVTEGILAGLVQEPPTGAGLAKPAASSGAVKLSFGGRKKAQKADAAAVPANATEAANKDSIAATGSANGTAAGGTKRPMGVGFVDFSDDFGYNDGDEYIPSKAELMDDDDMIDPDSLLTEEDRLRPVNIRTFNPYPFPPFLSTSSRKAIANHDVLQPKHANQTPSAAARAKTAAAGCARNSRPKTRPRAPRPTGICRAP